MSDTVIGSMGDRGEGNAVGKGIQQQRVDVQAVHENAGLIVHRLNEMQMDLKTISRRVDELSDLRRDVATVRDQTSKLVGIDGEFERRMLFFEREFDRRLEEHRRETDKRIEALWRDFNSKITWIYIRFGIAFVVLALGEIGLIFWMTR